MSQANGRFEVKLTPQPIENVETNLARMSIDKTFYGDLAGTSTGQMLSAGTSVKGSAGYVAIEQVRATLEGRQGTFLLQHNGRMDRGSPSLSVVVIPDSGTAALTGLSGTLTIQIAGGKHSYVFDYTLPPLD